MIYCLCVIDTGKITFINGVRVYIPSHAVVNAGLSERLDSLRGKITATKNHFLENEIKIISLKPKTECDNMFKLT